MLAHTGPWAASLAVLAKESSIATSRIRPYRDLYLLAAEILSCSPNHCRPSSISEAYLERLSDLCCLSREKQTANLAAIPKGTHTY